MITVKRCKNLTLNSLLDEKVEGLGIVKVESAPESTVLHHLLANVRFMKHEKYGWVESVRGGDEVEDIKIMYKGGEAMTALYQKKGGGWEWETYDISRISFYLSLETIRSNSPRISSGRGKITKFLSDHDFLNSSTKELMTDLKSAGREYELVLSNNIYSHYIKMKERGVCKSCMSYNKDHFPIELEWGEESPLVAYENDPDWSLLLIKDLSKKEERESDDDDGVYPYIARAIYHRPSQSVVRVYGQEQVGTAVIEKSEIVSLNSWYSNNPTLLRITDRNERRILPYLDGDDTGCEEGYTSDKGDVWSIGGGSIEANHETGCADEGWYCSYCEAHHMGEISGTDVDGDEFCEDAPVVYIEWSGEYYHLDHEALCHVECDEEWHHRDDDAVCYSDHSGEWYLKENCIYSDYSDGWLHTDDACYSEKDQVWYLESDTVYSEHHNSAILKYDAVMVEGEWFLEVDEDVVWKFDKEHERVLITEVD